MPDLLERLKSALADRYAVESEIGRGGMATVYLAEDLKHHRKVAIKVLHPELAAAVGGQRFLQEIETVASLNHPHILMLIDSGEADGLLYSVMPYAAGESLRRRLDREKQLSVDEAVRIAVEVADGLDYAHREGVVHRDIKPGNILLSEGHAVIADFGIARAIEAAREERITSTGLGVGTPMYVSPEQAIGEETLDGRTDIYSLACVLYEMLAGEPPLTGSTPQMIQARRMSETPTALHTLRETVPPELDVVIARALARVPADRYATASQFGQALQAVLMGRTPALEADLAATPSTGTTEPGVAEPERRRSPASRWLAAVGGLAVIAAATTVVWMQTTDRSATRRAEPVPAGATDLGPYSVAVLPLANNTGEDSLDWLGPGLANMLTMDLAQSEALRVVGSQRLLDLMRQAGLEETDRIPSDQAFSIGTGSGAHALVYGSFAKVGNDFRLDVQVIDPSDSTVTRTQQVQGTDVFTLADSVAAGLSIRVLGDTIAPTQLKPFSRIATGNLEAYREYQEGLLADRRILARENPAADRHYRRAVALDSTFALAWLQLGTPHYRYRGVWPDPFYLERAEELLDDASERDRLSIRAYLAWASRRLDESTNYLEALVASYPDEKEARFYLGVMYRQRDRPGDSRRVLEEVLWLDPYYAPAVDELSYQAALAGDEAWADSLWDQYVDLEPSRANPYASRGQILEMFGRKEEARVMFREAIRLDPGALGAYSLLTLSYMNDGDPKGARAALQPFQSTDDPAGAVMTLAYEADTYVDEGRYRDALAPMRSALEKAIELGSAYRPLLTGETGILANATGAYEEAEELFLEHLRLDPGSTHALFGILSVYGTQGRFDEMRSVRDAYAARLDAASGAMRGAAEGNLNFADALIAWYRTGDAEETVRLFGEGRAVSGLSLPEFDPGMGIQGEEIFALIEAGRGPDAVGITDSMEELAYEGWARLLLHAAWYLRGRAYEALGEPEQALNNYGTLLERAGDGVNEVVLFRDTHERVARLSSGLGVEQ